MATVQEKLGHFLQLFGDSGQDILSAANEVQKEADEMGVDFKEASEPPVADLEALKARKKKTVPPMDDEEETPEEDAGETEEEEMVEDEEKAFDDDEEISEFVDEPTSESDDEFFPLGEVDVKEFGSMLADVMAQALNPVMTQLKELRDERVTEKEAKSKMDKHQAEGVYLAVTAAKEHADRLDALEQQLAATRKELVQARKRLKELGDDMPKAFSGFVASEAEETELSENDPRMKEAGPKADPLGDFVSQFVMPNFK